MIHNVVHFCGGEERKLTRGDQYCCFFSYPSLTLFGLLKLQQNAVLQKQEVLQSSYLNTDLVEVGGVVKEMWMHSFCPSSSNMLLSGSHKPASRNLNLVS